MSWFVSSSPTLGSVLSAQSLLGFCLPLSLFLPRLLSISLSKINKNKLKKKRLVSEALRETVLPLSCALHPPWSVSWGCSEAKEW